MTNYDLQNSILLVLNRAKELCNKYNKIYNCE